MPAELWYPNGAESYIGLRHELYKHGEDTAPRGQATRELRNIVVTVEDPTDVFMVGTGRKLNVPLAIVEGVQLVGGFSDPAMTCAIAPNMAQFVDGGVLHGAYGPRIAPQLPAVLARLSANDTTRQAVAMIWDPARDLYEEGLKDYPCTIYLSWLVRNGKLEQTTHMRSNDLHWGWSYDLVQFTMLQVTMARFLKIPVGPYRHVVDSFHYYLRDEDAINAVHEPSAYADRIRNNGIGFSADRGSFAKPPWSRIAQLAKACAYFPDPPTAESFGDMRLSAMDEIELGYLWSRLHGFSDLAEAQTK